MLHDHTYQLLTAAVDGELSRSDQRAVDRLLRESAEAREFYRKLKSDATALGSLPRVSLPAKSAEQWLDRLTPRNPAQPSAKRAGLVRNLRNWANVVAAVAVLIALSLGTYVVMVLTEKEQPVVKQDRPPTRPSHGPAYAPSKAPEGPSGIVRQPHDPVMNLRPERLPDPRIEIADAGKPETPKAVEVGSQDLLTANPKASYDQLFVVDPKLPPIVAVRELDQNGTRQRLIDLLQKSDGVHLDLFCRDTNRAFERLQAAFKGQRLMIDAVARERLQRKLKTHFVFYSESLTPDDVQKVLQTLAVDERRAEAKKDGQFDKLVANALSSNSIKTLSMLLGVDPKWLQAKPKAPAPIDLSKPISDSTAESLAKSLRIGPAGLRGERCVLVLPYNPIRPNPLASKEVLQFLETVSGERKPGTLPVLLVLRTAE